VNKKIFIGILVVISLIVVFGFIWKSSQRVMITTDRTGYKLWEAPKIIIRNNLVKNICFSSCYPYFLEEKKENWKSCLCGKCQKPDLVEKCIESNQVKAFELILYKLEAGLYQIAVPVCIDCKVGQDFRESKRFYSNQFMVKEK